MGASPNNSSTSLIGHGMIIQPIGTTTPEITAIQASKSRLNQNSQSNLNIKVSDQNERNSKKRPMRDGGIKVKFIDHNEEDDKAPVRD